MLPLLSAPLVWDADPVIFHFGRFPIRWYTALFLAGVVLAERVISHRFEKQGLPRNHVGPLLIYTLAGTLLGAHLGHVLFYETQALLDDPARLLHFGKGLASHGGAIGGLLGALVMAKRYKVPALRYADIATYGFYWAIPFVRVGNFFNSEIYGRTTDLPWGVVFARHGFTEPRHPSQLYEALLGLLFLGFCYWLVRKHGPRLAPGLLVFLMPGLYCLTRFFIEFVKEYQALDPTFPLTMGQILSLPVMAFCGLVIWTKKLHRLRPAAEPRFDDS
jgi:prolipoprotein diacylglyceryl transferase